MTGRLDSYSRIIVTGGDGWLGSRLVQALTRGLDDPDIFGEGGHAVRCLVEPHRRADALYRLGVDTVVGDITDVKALEALFRDAGDALVIHTAGIIHPAGRTPPFMEINFGGTRNLLRAAQTAGARRLIAVSSNSPFGANPSPDGVFTEESPYNPYMAYGRSKMAMERLLTDAMTDSGGPDIVIARVPWFYGPNQPPRQTLFFTMIREGRFPLMGQGENRRSMGYIDNLVQGLLLCGSVPAAANRIYWFADERPYPMREIVGTVREVLSDDFGMAVSEKTLRLPAVVSDIARMVDAGLQAAGRYHQKIHVLSEMNLTIACDISRARTELGYRPTVALREGMRRSIEWCLANGLEI